MNGKSGSVFTVRLPTNARFYYLLCYTQIIIPSGAIFFNLSAFNFQKGTNIFIFKTIKQNIERKKTSNGFFFLIIFIIYRKKKNPAYDELCRVFLSFLGNTACYLSTCFQAFVMNNLVDCDGSYPVVGYIRNGAW